MIKLMGKRFFSKKDLENVLCNPAKITNVVERSINGSRFKEIRWFGDLTTAMEWLNANRSAAKFEALLTGREAEFDLTPAGYICMHANGTLYEYRIRLAKRLKF